MLATDYRALVGAVIRDRGSQEDIEFLLSPEHLDQYIAELARVESAISNQLAVRTAQALAKESECRTKGADGHREWVVFEESHRSWARSAHRVLNACGRRLAEARQIRRERDPDGEGLRNLLRRLSDYLKGRGDERAAALSAELDLLL